MAKQDAIIHFHNETNGNAPAAGDLARGELGIVLSTGKLYTKNQVDAVIELSVPTGAEIKTAYEGEASAFTNAQFTKLAGIETGADVTDATNVAAALSNGVATLTSTEVNQLKDLGTNDISNAEWGYLASTTASFTSTLKTKIDGIATSATANQTDATLKARANHTGTQLLSTISDSGSIASKDVWTGTQAAYDGLTPDADTIYLIEA